MDKIALCKELNARFTVLSGKQTSEHIGWEWDDWAAQAKKSVPQLLEDILYATLFFRWQAFGYRLFDVLAARPGEQATAILIDLMRHHREGSIRALAAATLGTLREPAAIAPMVAVLSDTRVRFPRQLVAVDGVGKSEYWEIISALADIGRPDTAILWELGQIAEGEHTPASLRLAAQEALARLTQGH